MDYPQDLPMNYRRKVPYQGNLSDLLYAPGYDKLQQDLVKVEQDKLQRELNLRNTPQWQELDFLNKAPQRAAEFKQLVDTREAERKRQQEMFRAWSEQQFAKAAAKREQEEAAYKARAMGSGGEYVGGRMGSGMQPGSAMIGIDDNGKPIYGYPDSGQFSHL